MDQLKYQSISSSSLLSISPKLPATSSVQSCLSALRKSSSWLRSGKRRIHRLISRLEVSNFIPISANHLLPISNWNWLWQMFCSHWQDNWVYLLLMVEFAYNNHHHPSIDTTPFFTNYGYHLTLMNVPSATQSANPNECIQWIWDAQEECKCMIKQSQEVSKWAYDKWKGENPRFEVGDSVWLKAMNLSTDEPSWNLQANIMDPSKSRRSYWILLIILSYPHNGGFMTSSMSMFFPKWDLTWFPDVGNLHCLL